MADTKETGTQENVPSTEEELIETFDNLESDVQSYARSFPVVFDRALGSHLYDREGKKYLDFLAGAGSLNYGHNNPVLKDALMEYIQRDGITHGLDLYTVAKEAFLDAFNELILQPRGMDCVVQFTGPTGTNAVEAAMKLARNITGRHNILSFTNGFHGVTLGALAATGNSHHRDAAGIPLYGCTGMPYDGYLGSNADSTEYIEKMLNDSSSSVDRPAAVLVETVQGEGGINAASFDWLRNLEALCRRNDMLLIVDDIQAGCGRTGSFFSFDEVGIKPDMVTLSKSLSGYGLPFAVVVIRSELDRWKPGEHNGTFRGNNHAFITAAKALHHYWSDDTFAKDVQRKADILTERFDAIVKQCPAGIVHRRGRGMMQGLAFSDGAIAEKITRRAFDHDLIIETSGADDEVVKFLGPLVIEDADMNAGLDIVERVTLETVKSLKTDAA